MDLLKAGLICVALGLLCTQVAFGEEESKETSSQTEQSTNEQSQTNTTQNSTKPNANSQAKPAVPQTPPPSNNSQKQVNTTCVGLPGCNLQPLQLKERIRANANVMLPQDI